jgi:hypothetical protein
MSTLSRDGQPLELPSQSRSSSSKHSDGSVNTHTNPASEESRDQRIEGATSGKFLYDANGHERYFAPTSLPFLILEMMEFLNAGALAVRTISGGPSPIEQTPSSMDYATYETTQDHINFFHDGLDLVLPPRIVLDAMVGPFFSKVHSLLPIFNKDNFDSNLEILYSGKSTGSDRAWTLCFNNIILLTLIPKTAQSQNLNTHMDTGLIEAFIGNSRRGLQHLAEFLAPKLCNIQAMITMVSRSAFHKNPAFSFRPSTQIANKMNLDSNGARKRPVKLEQFPHLSSLQLSKGYGLTSTEQLLSKHGPSTARGAGTHLLVTLYPRYNNMFYYGEAKVHPNDRLRH